MTGLDTNVLLRLLLVDDAAQVERARGLLEELASRGEAAYVPAAVVLEAVWVLGRRYRVPKGELVSVCRDLLGAAEFVVGDHDAVLAAVGAWEAGAGDFAEYLFRAQSQAAGAATLATFDRAVAGEPGFGPL